MAPTAPEDGLGIRQEPLVTRPTAPQSVCGRPAHTCLELSSAAGNEAALALLGRQPLNAHLNPGPWLYPYIPSDRYSTACPPR